MNLIKTKFEKCTRFFKPIAVLVLILIFSVSCAKIPDDTDATSALSLYDVASRSTTSANVSDTAEPVISDTAVGYTEEYVSSCLEAVSSISEISTLVPIAEGYPDGLQATAYFTSKYLSHPPRADITLESASYGGGCIEIYDSDDNARARAEYLSSPSGRAVSPCLHTHLDNLVIRTSEYLTVYNAVKLESELISALDKDAVTVASVFLPIISDDADETTAPKTEAPSPETAETVHEAVTSESEEQTVWIPKSGTKYHSKESCGNMKSPTAVTLTEAEALGYTPCKRCH